MGLIIMCGVVHTSIKVYADKFYDELLRRVYTTPKSYLDLINSYTSKLGQLQGGVQTKASQMEARRTCATRDVFQFLDRVRPEDTSTSCRFAF